MAKISDYEKSRGVHFPKSTRLAPDAYAVREAICHIIIRTHPQVGAMLEAVRNVIWASVLEQTVADRVHVIAACLMPDHLHMLVQPAALDLIRFLNVFKSWTTRQVWSVGHEGAFWQPGMWDRMIRDERDLETTVLYILENPVRAELVEIWEEWPYVWVATPGG